MKPVPTEFPQKISVIRRYVESVWLLARKDTREKSAFWQAERSGSDYSNSLYPEQASQAEEGLVNETLERSEGDDCCEPDDHETEVQTDLISQGIYKIQQELDTAYHKINLLEAKLP